MKKNQIFGTTLALAVFVLAIIAIRKWLPGNTENPSGIIATTSISPSSTNAPTQALIKGLRTGNTISIADLIITFPSGWEADPNNKMGFVTTRNLLRKATGKFSPGQAWIGVTAKRGTIAEIEKQTFGLKSRQETTVDGNTAIVLVGTTGIAGSVHYKDLVIQKKDIVYIIGLGTQDSDILPIAIPEFDQITSTVRVK